MYLSIRLVQNLSIVFGAILVYYFIIFLMRHHAIRAQRQVRRKEYDRLFVDIVTAASNEDLVEICLAVENFSVRFYDEDPHETFRYVTLLKKFIGKKLASLDGETDKNFIG